MGESACSRGYTHGCRCRRCTDYSLKEARARYHRRQFGIEASSDRLPVEATRAAINRMLATGLTLRQITHQTGLHHRSLPRILTVRKYVTRELATIIAETEVWFAEHPDAEPFSSTRDPELAVWMVRTLIAQGWNSEHLGTQVGWSQGGKLLPNQFGSRITNDTYTRVETVFREHHDKWGPSRSGARRMWRKGFFPSDCYNWDQPIPDLRPIPGSLRPELVREAATIPRDDGTRREQILTDMSGWGQWPDPACANSAMYHWLKHTHPGERIPWDTDELGLRCWDHKLHRTVPEVWRGRP
jgi:hypothetical protein